jgi:hypothetical protein
MKFKHNTEYCVIVRTLATEGNFINNFQIPVTSHLQGTTEFKTFRRIYLTH